MAPTMKPDDRRAGRRPRMTAAEARRLDEAELFERLERLVIETRGNISEVARRMEKDRSTIRYHLRRFGMLSDQARRVEPASAGPVASAEDRSGRSKEDTRE